MRERERSAAFTRVEIQTSYLSLKKRWKINVIKISNKYGRKLVLEIKIKLFESMSIPFHCPL